MSEKDKLSRKPSSPASKSLKQTGASGAPQSTRGQLRSTSTPKPASGAPASEEAQAKLQQLEDDLETLREKVTFSDHRQAVNDLDHGVGDLPAQVERLRERGYRYKNYLERKIATIERKWREAEPTVRSELNRAENEYMPQYEALSRRYSALAGAGGRSQSQLSALERDVEALSGLVDDADRVVQSAYAGVRQTFYQAQQQVKEIEFLFEQIEQAGFELLVGENPIQAVSAKWWRDGKKKGPEGILYLTDQRLLFEQKEKVATKRVLFVATEKEEIQETLIDVPVGGVSSVKASSRGIGGHQDHIDIAFSEGSVVEAHFHLKGQDSEMWAGLVKQVLNGEIEREKYYPEGVDAAAEQASVEEALTNAPSKCPSCGAPLADQIVKGQRQLECEYCGMVVRW